MAEKIEVETTGAPIDGPNAQSGARNIVAASDDGQSGYGVSSILDHVVKSGDGKPMLLREFWVCDYCPPLPAAFERVVQITSAVPDPLCRKCFRTMTRGVVLPWPAPPSIGDGRDPGDEDDAPLRVAGVTVTNHGPGPRSTTTRVEYAGRFEDRNQLTAFEVDAADAPHVDADTAEPFAWWVEDTSDGTKRLATVAEIDWAMEGLQPSAPFRVIGTNGEYPRPPIMNVSEHPASVGRGAAPPGTMTPAERDRDAAARDFRRHSDAKSLCAYLSNLLRGKTLADWEIDHVVKLCERNAVIAGEGAGAALKLDAQRFVERRATWAADQAALRKALAEAHAKHNPLVSSALVCGLVMGGSVIAMLVFW